MTYQVYHLGSGCCIASFTSAACHSCDTQVELLMVSSNLSSMISPLCSSHECSPQALSHHPRNLPCTQAHQVHALFFVGASKPWVQSKTEFREGDSNPAPANAVQHPQQHHEQNPTEVTHWTTSDECNVKQNLQNASVYCTMDGPLK